MDSECYADEKYDYREQKLKERAEWKQHVQGWQQDIADEVGIPTSGEI